MNSTIPDFSCLVNEDTEEINRINSKLSQKIKDDNAKEELIDYFTALFARQYPDMSFYEAWKEYKENCLEK